MLQKIIDVRGYPPYERHRIILEEFERLKPGESLTIVNDHEPVHLFHAMAHREDIDIDAYHTEEVKEGKWVALLKKREIKPSEVIFTNIDKKYLMPPLPSFKFVKRCITRLYSRFSSQVNSYLFTL